MDVVVQQSSPSTVGAMQSSTSSVASSGEIVYGTDRTSIAGSDESRVMSEKVQLLASSIYKEFELMIQKFGEETVKNLMPLVVNVLESLDLSYLEKEEHAVELELLKEDNEQLATQYEREKQLRKLQDQKCMEIEDTMEVETKELEAKIESMESIVRMLELKAKNASDHSIRLEERELEQKQEYSKLHERYTELLKTHMDYMERTKYLMGNDKFDMIQSMTMPASSDIRAKMGMATSMEGGHMSGAMAEFVNAQMTQSLPVAADQSLSNQINEDWQDEFGQNADALQSPRNSDVEMEPPKQRIVSKPQPKDDTTDDSLGADLTESDEEDVFLASIDPNNLAGMGREVENLIKENTELLETKNALNIVKNDLIARVDELSSEQEILREEIRSLEMVRSKMNEKMKELEIELKATKEKLEDAKKSGEDGEEDIPLAQRKRFTRVEMARVLMERNQYKEKLMELQEALRFTEMVRAKKQTAPAKKSAGIWDFFSGLFTSAEPSSSSTNDSAVRFRKPGSDPLSRRKSEKAKKTLDFLDHEYSSEKRAAERREQYKAVRAHVKKDESGRLQAYGWSIPAHDSMQNSIVPVPVFCRPLMDHEPNLKIWCGTSVTLSGGRTKDGGFIVGDSVFYSQPNKTPEQTPPVQNSIQQKELQEFEALEWESSSLIWVCSSAHGNSHVTILDANNPNQVLDTFSACTSHLLCVTSVPGVRETDYPTEQSTKKDEFVRDGGYYKSNSGVDVCDELGRVEWVAMQQIDDENETVPTFSGPNEKVTPKKKRSRDFSTNEAVATDGATSTVDSNTIEQQKKVRSCNDLPDHIKDGLSKYAGITEVTTALPTIWMGSQNDYIFIHSTVSNWRKCLRQIKMPDSILSIVHYKGRNFAALANGCIAVFNRDSNGQWSTAGYHLLTIGKTTSSVRSLVVVAGRIWAAYRNCVVVINASDLRIETVFSAHPRKDSQVRQMVWIGDGVWLSIRLDSTLRLYHAHTYQHLQDVDIEPYVSKMLGTNKIGLSLIRTTAMLVSCRRLWIGTGTGVIVSVPLSENNETKVQTSADDVKGPGGLIRVYSNPTSDRVAPGSFIPYCNMTLAQLSFHGHKDAVKFFMAAPSHPAKSTSTNDETGASDDVNSRMLVVSGGDGYIDFRIGEDEEVEDTTTDSSGRKSPIARVRDMSHLIVWEIQPTADFYGSS